MKTDNGIFEVYHTGTDIIKSPDCKRGRKNLYFGQGFYVTDISNQTINFARSKSVDRQLPTKINIYLLDKRTILSQANSIIFEKTMIRGLNLLWTADLVKMYEWVMTT